MSGRFSLALISLAMVGLISVACRRGAIAAPEVAGTTPTSAVAAASGGAALPCPSPASLTPKASEATRGYVSGRVVSIAPDRLVVRTSDTGDVTLYPACYRLWDDLWVKDIPIEIGDEITASDAAFGGPQLYVNIVNLIGSIYNVRQDADTLLFEMRSEVRFSGEERTDMIKVEKRARVSGSGPREGQGGQVIGRRLKDGAILATTVFFFDGP